jgi:Family of unknown function (DUF6527)
MRRSEITHEFVEFVPAELDAGTLYVSIPYATSVHLCACGCGNKVVAPISPAEWQLIYDGDSVSLYPSIGNWEFPCQSHYWIRRNQIEWSRQWSPRKIETGRQRDAADLARYYRSSLTELAPIPEPAPPPPRHLTKRQGRIRSCSRELTARLRLLIRRDRSK